ncbi:MAG: hypothetical protein IVW51_02255 [Thermaceae bacterium]|nr:hypothetical protein [Thermaceae bacterium]
MDKDWALGLGWETIASSNPRSEPYAFLFWKGKPLLEWMLEVQKTYYPYG